MLPSIAFLVIKGELLSFSAVEKTIWIQSDIWKFVEQNSSCTAELIVKWIGEEL